MGLLLLAVVPWRPLGSSVGVCVVSRLGLWRSLFRRLFQRRPQAFWMDPPAAAATVVPAAIVFWTGRLLPFFLSPPPSPRTQQQQQQQ